MATRAEVAPLNNFFCQNADYELNSIEAIIKGPILRLVRQSLRDRWETIHERFHEDVSSWRGLWNTFMEMLERCQCPRVYIVIDALDECRDDGMADLLKLIVRTGLGRPSQINWLLTSRPLDSGTSWSRGTRSSGSSSYLALDVFSGLSNGHGPPVGIWSLGVIAFEWIYGVPMTDRLHQALSLLSATVTMTRYLGFELDREKGRWKTVGNDLQYPENQLEEHWENSKETRKTRWRKYLESLKELLETSSVAIGLVSRKGEQGNSALALACMAGQDVVRLLNKRDADIESVNLQGQTPLMEAPYYGHGAIAEFLVSEGASTSVKDEEGTSILDVAKGTLTN
ncbi:MAG: hypothetical protein M1816_002781 [Peltula sp. TS41687]|nr:MAG: hypothetical protein M1816_002781 [Peltula sp. TS41687]